MNFGKAFYSSRWDCYSPFYDDYWDSQNWMWRKICETSYFPAVSMKMTVFWLCSLVEVHWYFRAAHYLHHHGSEEAPCKNWVVSGYLHQTDSSGGTGPHQLASWQRVRWHRNCQECHWVQHRQTWQYLWIPQVSSKQTVQMVGQAVGWAPDGDRNGLCGSLGDHTV
jgi:hypothetical protein